MFRYIIKYFGMIWACFSTCKMVCMLFYCFDWCCFYKFCTAQWSAAV